jgi:5-formyltetrahydrofolate cyclo-ligase
MIHVKPSLQTHVKSANWNLAKTKIFPKIMKQAIRQKTREARSALPANLRAEKSAIILEKLKSTQAFQEAKSLLLYVSNKEEVDTHDLVRKATASSKKIYVPKVSPQEDGPPRLIICPIVSWDQLKPGNFGILEPCEVLDPANPEEIDLILVPGIAFDIHGNRIGYGRGFYDSLLAGTRGTKIGLAFTEQIVDDIPAEEHDIALDIIITDENIIHP